MENAMQTFRQSFVVFEKPGILSENLKIWRAPTTIQLNIFCWNFAHISYVPVSTHGFAGLFLFCLDRELFAKIKKLKN